MGKNIIISYLEDEYWSANGKPLVKIREIRVVPLAFRKTVYGLNIYFPADGYCHEWKDYEEFKDIVSSTTNNSAWVETLHSGFRQGFATIMLNISHREYSDERIVVLLKKLTGKFFPELKLSHPARC